MSRRKKYIFQIIECHQKIKTFPGICYCLFDFKLGKKKKRYMA